ncbi:MAG: efflux RND transporter permease subunit [Candidatus Kerfeldbacteria bacterium]
MELKGFFAKWSSFFITRYKTTVLLIIAISIAGIWGVLNNQRQDFPPIQSNYVFVQSIYPGASAEDVEQEILAPVEQLITDVEGVKLIRSSASNNFASLFIELDDFNNQKEIVSNIEDMIAQAGLPADVETTAKIYDVAGPSVVYALSNGGADKAKILAEAEQLRERLLNASDDVKRIDIAPKNEFVVFVRLDAEKMNDNNLQSQQVTDAIRSAIASLPGGSITNDSGETLAISIEPSARSLDDIKEIEINGVALSEIAEIVREPKEQEQLSYAGFIDSDGNPVSKEAVYLEVMKKDDGDIITIANDLKSEVEQIEEDGSLPEGMALSLVYDNSEYTQQQISDLLYNGWLGLILILVVLMFFINLRTGIAVATIIPLAFLATLGVLYFIGFTINIMTLFGLLLVLGILVDNAIVIGEGVNHALDAGKKKREAVIETVKNYGPAITTATLTTIVAFIPFAMIGGLIGEFLKYVPITIIIMLVVSYLLAITVMPVMARLLLKEQTKEQRLSKKLPIWQMVTVLPAIVHYGQRSIDLLEEHYARMMASVYSNLWKKITVVVAAVVLLGVSIGAYAVRSEILLLPTDDGNIVSVNFKFPATLSFEKQSDIVSKVMAQTVKTPYFKSYYQFEGQFLVILEDPNERAEGDDVFTIVEEMDRLVANEQKLLDKEGVAVKTSPLGIGPPEEEYDVVIEMRGQHFEGLDEAAADLKEWALSKEGVTEVAVSSEDDAVEGITVDLDSEALEEKGVDPFVASAVINSVFSKQTVGSIVVRDDGVSDDIIVEYSEDSKTSVDDINGLVVGVAGGFPPELVTVQDIADVRTEQTLRSISRLNQLRMVAVRVKVDENTDAAVVESDIKEYLNDGHLEQFNLSADDIAYGGFTASINESFDNLVIVFIIAVIAVYLILVYQFNSFLQPGLIMLAVPLAMIGVFPALYYIGSSINMVSGLGIIALVGIVVNDAIVFMDYYNRIKGKGLKTMAQDLVETGRARFKPILSTSITTVFGILPLTIMDPFWRGLGTALIAGLICATAGTLIILPVFLSWAEIILSRCKKVGDRARG